MGYWYYLCYCYFWLNSRYETKEEAAVHDGKFDELETEFLLYKQRLKTLEGRFEKKLKILNKHTKEIDDNENYIIRLQEQNKK